MERPTCFLALFVIVVVKAVAGDRLAAATWTRFEIAAEIMGLR